MRTWDSKSVGSAWQHAFFYLLIRILGRRIAYGFMYVVILWYILFSPLLHQRCRPYLSRRFPKAGQLSMLWYKFRWISALGKTLIDRAAYGILGEHTIHIDVPDGPMLAELLKEGKGLIIVSAHTGCWQIAFSALRFFATSVHIVMHRDYSDIDRQFYEHKNATPPFEIIDPADYLGGTLRMISVLQDGGVLGLMGDRVFGNETNTVAVDFLGEKVDFPVAAYRLAAMRGTPIAVLFSYKESFMHYHVQIAGIMRLPTGVNRNSHAYMPYVQEYARYLQNFVDKYPFDFYNFHQMWRSVK